jgi:hypothetical protein
MRAKRVTVTELEVKLTDLVPRYFVMRGRVADSNNGYPALQSAELFFLSNRKSIHRARYKYT